MKEYKTPQWLDDFTEAGHLISNAAHRLSIISDNLESVGLSKVSGQCAAIVEALDRAAELSKKALSENINEGFRQSEQATSNMMRGILAVLPYK